MAQAPWGKDPGQDEDGEGDEARAADGWAASAWARAAVVFVRIAEGAFRISAAHRATTPSVPHVALQ